MKLTKVGPWARDCRPTASNHGEPVRTEGALMRSRFSLLMLVLLGSPTWAQELFLPALPPPTLGGTCPEVLCPEDNAGRRAGGMLTGNTNFPGFIGFLSNPLQNIDPRAVTEIYPIFGSAWTSEAGPVPRSDLQLYGAGLTFALSDRLAMGLNQGGYADVHLSRGQFDRLARLDPQGRFRDVEVGGDRSGWLNLGGFFQY